MSAEMLVPDLTAPADRWRRILSIGFTDVLVALLLPVFAFMTALAKASNFIRQIRG